MATDDVIDVAPSTETLSPSGLEHCLRDLISLLALPALCSGKRTSEALATIGEFLSQLLPAPLVYARFSPRDRAGVEWASLDGRTLDAAGRAAVLKDDGERAGTRCPIRVDVPLGFRAERGRLLLGSDDPGFPSPIQVILLRAGGGVTTSILETAARDDARRATEQKLRMLLEAAAAIHAATDVDDIHAETERHALRILGFGEGNGHPVAAWIGRADVGEEESAADSSDDHRLDLPVMGAGQAFGRLRISGLPRPPSDADRAGLEQLAHLAAIALERATALAEARRADQRKDEFLALLGHELRNPLAPMLTALQLMKLKGSDNTEREREVIERQVRHMTQLVDDLLDVSRLTSGKLELRTQPVEISSAVSRAIEMAAPLIERYAHRLTVDVPPSGLRVEGDPFRLAQVLANLLTNSAKYTPEGGHIHVSARRRGGRIHVCVKDDGRGIRKDMLEQIFEPFVQVDRNRDALSGGLGLGLPLVRNLVRLHHGTVLARSDGPGRGTEMHIELPALPEEAVSRSPAASPAGQPVPYGERTRVLVVDDNADGAEMIAESLRMLGYVVDVAYDGPSALEAAEEFAPKFAVVDIGLPLMDGYQLARHLRARFGDELRLLAVTGYGQREDVEKAREAGFAAHFVKPVDVGALAQRLRRLEIDGSSA